MKRATTAPSRQLGLYREREHRYVPTEDLREEVVKALADLLLEALGEEGNNQATDQRGVHEFKDHI